MPWKGIQTGGDPESDPYITPGSVLGSPGPPTLNDSDHQLLRDNIGIKENVENLLSWHFTVSQILKKYEFQQVIIWLQIKAKSRL